MNLKEWCKNNYNKVIFISLCIFSSIVYMQFIMGHYATDTYNIAYVGYDTYMKNWYLTDGRIFSAMFLFIMKIFNLSVESANTISLLFAIVITNISVMKIFNWTEKYVQIKNIKEKIILLIICYVIFWNFTYIENMYFLESSIMALSVLFYTMSAISLVEKNKYSFLKALMFAILGIISYQGTIGFLFILTALLTFIKNPKNYKANIVDIVKSGLIAGMAVIVDFAIVAIVENLIGTKQTRLSDFTRIFLNIKIILRNTKDVLTETCNLYPENLFIIWIIALLAILFVYEIKNKDELIKEKVSVILKYILLVILAIFSSSVIYIISMSGFWAGRLRFAIGSLIGILFLYIATQTRLFFRKEAKEKTFVSDVTIVLLVIYFLTVVVFNVFFMYEHRQVNKLEKQESERILEYISKYEEETKNEVKKVQVITIECEEEKSYYSQVAAHNVLTYNGLSANWSAVGCLNFFSQKELIEEKGEISQEILYEVMDNVEDEVCIGDTVYMKCYMY